ncbi:PREDICTED: putative RING-H2 finger protein ATL35 [Camelina sativa]|uniref:RING-type E3 ubiquitin transferase n=1 Tax=Camelina sativa TaxID=90675 RepID=A0ABM0VIP7_CAMSA|nr:PREDICTED: putative RING-H2 finger protein ATL35 [Camelina sativa]
MFFFFVIYGTCATDGEAGGHEAHEVLHSRATIAAVDKEVIESFPTFLYSEVKGLKIGNGGVECAICLYEFEDEDTLRWIPPCSHTFHGNCIDVWLSSRSTCPVCRANLSLKPGESFPYPCMDLETGNTRRNVLDGRSFVHLGKNLDRFTLQLPEEVQRKLVSLNLVRRSHMALPQAMSSRQGYRSGFFQGQQTLTRAISKSLSFTFQASSVRSTIGRDDLVLETSQVKNKDLGEQLFQRLMRDKV